MKEDPQFFWDRWRGTDQQGQNALLPLYTMLLAGL